jgi:hypothetical protein
MGASTRMEIELGCKPVLSVEEIYLYREKPNSLQPCWCKRIGPVGVSVQLRPTLPYGRHQQSTEDDG